jgi:GntR family transcriptional regulator / MocR family aminotransferase
MPNPIRPLTSGAPVEFSLFEETSAPRSLRERICAAIRAAIQSGRARYGERLPASRTLADDLKVSRITAEAAYAQLEAEGYVRRRVGDGTYVDLLVSSIAEAAPGPPAPGRIAGRAAWSRRGAAILRGGGCADPRDTVAFSAGFPDLAEFPLETWKRLTARRQREDGPPALRYGDPAGEPELRGAIARYLGPSRGVRCTADQVLVLTSSQHAIQLAAAMLTDVGDTVWIEDPGYRGARTALASMGTKLVPVPVDRDGLRPPRATSGPPPRLIYVTPSHQYPTGVTFSLPRRLQLLEHVHQRGGYIVEDDYDSEFQYDARPTPALQGLDAGDRVIYVGTFSKVLFPALRLAYLVLPQALVRGFITARTVHDGHPARLAQRVTADFMAEGHFAAHVRRMRRLYRQRRDLLLSEIARRLDPWCRPLGTAAGLQMTVTLPRGREAALTRAAARAGVVTPGVGGLFLSRQRLDGWVLGFAALREPEIVEGVRRLATIRVRSRGRGGRSG